MKKNENDLVTFFDAGTTSERIGADLERKIHAIRDDAAIKIAPAELKQATALRTIKDRGETVASIAEATDLSTAEIRKLLKQAPASTAPETVSTPNDELTTAKRVPRRKRCSSNPMRRNSIVSTSVISAAAAVRVV